ncbi:MAG: Gfo/Idh/MocA family oxidoreductase [Firmicutes bacterium]|nr:Gfo/Idh/MocA family oxidoreductase [Bacillota bacterium]
MAKLRIGIVGTGFIAKYHFDGFRNNPEAEVVGMCTHSNQEKLHQMCNQWGIKPYPNFDAMAEDPKVDALVIGSVNHEHFPQIMKAIALGKPTLVEKPVVTDFGHLEQIREQAAKKGVVVFPGHNFVYRKAAQEAKKIAGSGKLGRITYASFISTHTISTEHQRGWRSKLALGTGGALIDSGHHQVYQSLYLRGMPQKIQAFKSRLVLKEMEGEDIAQINLLYPDGSLGCIMQSWTSNFGEGINGIRILGDRGRILITDALYFNGEMVEPDADYANSFVNQARAFTDCVFKGIPPVSDLEDVRNTLKLIFGAYESSEREAVVNTGDIQAIYKP